MGRPIVHFEIMGKDGGKLSDFYKRAFDWEIQQVPEDRTLRPITSSRRRARGSAAASAPRVTASRW